MGDIWAFLLQTLTASGAAVLLLAIKALLRDKLSPRWQFASWGVLALVLLLPAGRLGRYTLVNWPFYVEWLRSALTGEYGALARVTAPVPIPKLEMPATVAEWLFLLYEAGVLFFLLRYLASYLRLRLALRKGKKIEDNRLRAVAERYDLPLCPAVEVPGLPTAFVCGVLRPVLALPAGEGVDEKVLLHELLHLKYRDAVWGWVMAAVRCLHWCNPLLWLCADWAGNDLEALCDQRVLERLEGEARREYGLILLDMADEKYARAVGTSSIANGGKNIRRRIEAIARFKRYPRGMALVSVCVLLVLAAPLAVGARASVTNRGPAGTVSADLAYARTVPCTTYAGAFDTYAKAVLCQRLDYRAMCAPLSEQNTLAGYYSTAPLWTWEEMGLHNNTLTRYEGYEINDLSQVAPDVYEGTLALTLDQAPEGEEWSGVVHERWRAIQDLRAEKEGERWVVVPQGEFTLVQGDLRNGGDLGLPAWEYAAPAGDFTLRLRWQTTSQVDSRGEPNWMGISTYETTPIPDGSFTSDFRQMVVADYTGVPEDREGYQSIGVVYHPMWDGEARPDLPPLQSSHGFETDWSGGSNRGDGHANKLLDYDWGEEIFLAGGGSQREGLIDLPNAYAADLYLNGEKACELTLLPVEGGERDGG